MGRLQFASPLSMDGVTGVIIWGSEGNTTGRKELLLQVQERPRMLDPLTHLTERQGLSTVSLKIWPDPPALLDKHFHYQCVTMGP